MRPVLVCALAIGLLATGVPSHSEVRLLGIGTLNGSKAGPGMDLSGQTFTLENGQAANLLGGIGSGLDYAGKGVFLALPDRGPNAMPYNPAISDTTSYVSRFHTLNIRLSPQKTQGELPLRVTPELVGTTLLYSSAPLAYGPGAGSVGRGEPNSNRTDRFYFSGRADNFSAAPQARRDKDARFDPEAIRLSKDGRSVFISDEYGPYLRQFDRASGRLIKTFALPENLAASTLSAVADVEIQANRRGRVANKGMEGLALTPDGKVLVGAMQAALEQDLAIPATKKLIRLNVIDIASGRVHQFGYLLTDGSGVSEILAINSHEFLVLERDGRGLGEDPPAVTKKLYRIDLARAVDITHLSGEASLAAVVDKSQVLDIVEALVANGTPIEAVPAKMEGLSFGPDITLNKRKLHTLFVSNDNDFVSDKSGQNRLYVFGYDRLK